MPCRHVFGEHRAGIRRDKLKTPEEHFLLQCKNIPDPNAETGIWRHKVCSGALEPDTFRLS
jgi:hypothetical protein